MKILTSQKIALLAVLALAGCGTAAAQSQPAPTVTRTVQAPPKVITKTVTKTVPVPGPTVTVNSGGSQMACESYTVSGVTDVLPLNEPLAGTFAGSNLQQSGPEICMVELLPQDQTGLSAASGEFGFRLVDPHGHASSWLGSPAS